MGHGELTAAVRLDWLRLIRSENVAAIIFRQLLAVWFRRGGAAGLAGIGMTWRRAPHQAVSGRGGGSRVGCCRGYRR